jgi:hypothetical protein
MTPLAHAIAKQAMIKAQKRVPVYSADTKELIEPEALVSDIHCFECTEVFDLACDLVDSGRLSEVLDERIFLPAPETWIEHKDDKGRHAWLLKENPLSIRVINDYGGHYGVVTIDLSERSEDKHAFHGIILAMLAIINAPHIVCRQTFKPHKRIERMWARHVRKVPLNAWHELKLRVNKPIEIDDDEPHSAQISGRRALHFCRAHLRIRQGRLEFVTSHWRGDAALGTKLTRYRVAHG